MRRSRTGPVGAAVAVVVAAATAVLTPTGAQAAPLARHDAGVRAGTAPTIAWSKDLCVSAALKAAGAECGYLSVPLDYEEPDGAQIQIAVSRVRHTVPDSQYQGVVLVNPGGPGGSGLGLATRGSAVPGGVGKSYDWIGFDPRGVGRSKPALSCDPAYTTPPRPRYDPVTRAIEKDWLSRVQAYAEACGKAQPELLKHVTTVDTVRDMDQIRRAVGEKQINYYGYSYGTYLGQVYATLFPKRVRRMVLDSVVDPTRVWYDANLDQDVAFNRAIQEYFGWLADNDAVFHLGTTRAEVSALYYRELEALAAKPAGGTIGAAEWADIFTNAGYRRSNWLRIARLWSAWNATHADPKPLQTEYDNANGPGDDNGYAMYLATECTDAPWPEDWKVWRRDNRRVAAEAPFLTWSNAWFNAPCAFWPAPSTDPVEVTGRRAPGILLINETLDAATPYSGALEVRKRFPRASLVEGVGGTSHTSSLKGLTCIDTAVANYLRDGTLPERKPGRTSDLQCQPYPAPVATPAPAAAA